ncbi:MAG TPA: GAF domain-containing protein, partial [Chloroflexi bacterium]|nr:GAF domain-containing protein [Chloroflexota bacterium]
MKTRLRRPGRSRDELPSRGKNLASIAAVATAIAGIPQLDRFLCTALDELLKLFRADKGAIHLAGPDGQQLLLHAQRGFSTQYLNRHASLGLGEQVPGIVAQTGEPLLIEDFALAADTPIHMGGEEFRSLVCEPLLLNGEKLGTITLLTSQPRIFDEHTAQLLEFIARHISAGIRGSRLFEERETRARQMSALNEIRQTIGTTLDLVQVLKLVAQKTAQVCSAERCS